MELEVKLVERKTDENEEKEKEIAGLEKEVNIYYLLSDLPVLESIVA